MSETQPIRKSGLSYIKEGKGDVLIFLHGFCGSAHYWDELIPLLSDDFTVICVNLRGHGGNQAEDTAFEITDMARDLYHFISENSLDQVYMFGHSLSGYISLAFAELFPSKLKGFGLIHSTAYPDTDEAKEARIENINLIDERGLEAFVDRLIPNLFSKDSLAQLKDKVSKVKEIGYATDVNGAKGALMAMRNRPDRNYVLRETSRPVLLVAGEKDKVAPPEKVFSVEDSHIKTELLPKAGHMGMLETPEELARIIKNWIKLTELKK
ncbi:alpha/beta fold hydrolase [Peribacillus deserti]|uniref:Alpha/beta hydrolase n=1 Tax=Peribacillus deserti TaxID=673318 RepID=A0A2N5M1W4_9BACI|nr:alpha/beta hydrolase [Peribacillus deserti]PLT28374.1 alpha/beta hydrolase [Peribacillus deserti]